MYGERGAAESEKEANRDGNRLNGWSGVFSIQLDLSNCFKDSAAVYKYKSVPRWHCIEPFVTDWAIMFSVPPIQSVFRAKNVLHTQTFGFAVFLSGSHLGVREGINVNTSTEERFSRSFLIGTRRTAGTTGTAVLFL